MDLRTNTDRFPIKYQIFFLYRTKAGYVYCAVGTQYLNAIKLLAPELFFLILAHSVYKM